MNIQWESTKASGIKHSNRWGHSSATLPSNCLVLFGGYAGKFLFQLGIDSKFLKDVWVFNPSQNSWAQVKFNQNQVHPCERSNCTFIYSDLLNGIIMFGGGSTQNAKLNDLWCLKISENIAANSFEGNWKQIYPQNGKVPWGRTYHVGQIFHNFLLIHGGESYSGEIDDFWALNLENLCWIQLKNQLKNQARKFHTSAILKQKLYIIGGIYGSYQTINKIQFVDLAILKSNNLQTIEDHRFQWKQVDLNGHLSSMICRWGHISKVYENNVYIFGGRNSVQLNDLLIFDPKSHQLQKVSIQKMPQGRRKPCAWLIGSVLIINSGYNGTYLSDQYWIDLRFARQQFMPQKMIASPQFVHKRQLCDIHINTADNKYIDMYSKLIRNSFQTEEDMIGMIEELAEMKHEMASKYVEILTNGVYINKNITDSTDQELIFSNKKIAENDKFDVIEERKLKKYKITFSTNELLANKKKILFNVVKQNTVMNLNPLKLIRVTGQEFTRIFNLLQNDCCCDLKISFSELNNKQITGSFQKALKCCRYPLAFRSEYFRNVIQSIEKKTNSKRGDTIEIEISGNANEYKLMKVVILYCYYGHVIIPKDLNLIQCINLFKLAKRFALQSMTNICYAQIKDLIFSKDMNNWINLKINKKQRNEPPNKFNPQKIAQKQQVLNSLPDATEFISQLQFEELIAFFIAESKIFDKKSSKLLKKPSNKWEQIFLYLICRFSEFLMKKHVQKSLKSRLEESKLMKRQGKARNSIQKSYSNKENINSSNKQNLAESIVLQKEQNSQKKVIQKKDNNKNGYFDTIVSLIKSNLFEDIASQSKGQAQTKELKGNELKDFIQKAVMKEKIKSEFKFKTICSELLKV